MRRWAAYMLAGLAAATAAAGSRPADGDGPPPSPAAREEVYEFTAAPTVVRTGSRQWEVRFASRGRCDVAVAVEDAKGRIVRHLVAGVLGANAPAPLKKDSLRQAVAWDGKDDAGAYVAEPGACRVRVSLGLKPAFDKLLAWHPKDVTDNRDVGGLAADKDGVYVLELSCRNRLKVFGHDGRYLRTLFPFRGDLVGTDKLVIPTRKVELTDRVVPTLSGLGGVDPLSAVGDFHSLAVGGGRIATFSTGEHSFGNQRRLLRMRTDGTTGGEPCVGAVLRRGWQQCRGPANVALSGDGRWVYVGGLFHGGRDMRGATPPLTRHAVYRFAWDANGPIVDRDPAVGQRPYVGRAGTTDSGFGKDNDELNEPEGLALDSQGRLYICDTGNARIQVFSTQDALGTGKFLRSIPFPNARQIALHHQTGEIYVLSHNSQEPTVTRRHIVVLTKLGPLDAPAMKFQQKFSLPDGDERTERFVALLCVDSWSKPARVWAVLKRGVIRVFEDRGDRLELVEDFEQDVAKAGLRPHALGGALKNRLEVDPVRGHLYYLRNNQLLRCDPSGPGRLVPVTFDGGLWEEIDFSLDGLLHMRALKYLVRFDPDKAAVGEDKVHLPMSAEVPFDYGEEQSVPWTRMKYRGALKIRSLPGANGFDTGIGVAPNGDIVAFMKNYRTRDAMLWGRPKDKWVDAWGEAYMKEASTEGYTPRIFPGRFAEGGELVMRWNARGEMIGEDIIPELPMPSCGIKADREGNLFVGIGANTVLPDGSSHSGGSLGKFPPRGGRFFGVGDRAKLADLPARPAEFRAYGWGDLWTEGMLWSYPGLDHMHFLGGGQYACLCATCRFDIDLYGRSFVPKAYQFTVGVLDTNGNRICRIGQYGNADSGRGGDSLLHLGESGVALSDCAYLATDSDRWLYLNDDGGGRIIRVRLGYHVEKTVDVPTE